MLAGAGAARCRLCLGSAGLAPIFRHSAAHARYSAVLALATGLQIELDDGLPQTICNACIACLNSAIDFRNQSHRAEQKLLQWGYKRKEARRLNKHTAIDLADAPNDRIKKEEISYGINSTTNLNNVTQLPIEYDKSECSSPNFCNDALESENEVVPETAEAQSDRNQNVKTNIGQVSVKNSRELKCDKKKRYEQLVDGPMGPAHPGPFECKSCKKVLKSWSSFRTHAKIHLGFDFMCEFCGKTFIAVTMLQRHCMSQHGTEKTYRCKLCDHRTLDSERLKIHERREHTGERPYVCDACAVGFHTRRNLVNHLAVHMTQRTVQCAKCPARFKSAQHLACHTSKVHTHRDVRMQCYLCDNTYTKYENVRKHLAKLHGVPRQHQLAIRRVRVPAEA